MDTDNLHHRPADVVIIGGGLAGLTAAATVAKAGKRALVYERRRYLGGDARSTTHDCFTFNQGPHALYRGGPAERVLAELGIAISGGVPPVRGQVIFGGQSFTAPAGLLTLLQTKALNPRDKLEVARVLGKVPKIRPGELATVSVNGWIDAMVSRGRPRQLLHMLTRLSTYANHPDVMSAEVAVTQIQLALGPGVLYLHGGWQSLVDQLAATPGVETVCEETVDELPDAPVVIIAGGGPMLASKLLNRTFDVGLSAEVSSLDLGIRLRPSHDIVLGGDTPFYFSNHSSVADLAPPDQYTVSGLQYLGCGDEPDPDGILEFTRHAGVRDDDIVHSRRLHRMTAVSAIATAELGGLRGRPQVDNTGLENVFIAGDWVGAEGHLADAAIGSGRAAAEAALRCLDKVAG